MKTGDRVFVNTGNRIIEGVISKVYSEDDKYVCVKHDNFSGEVFPKSAVTLYEDAKAQAEEQEENRAMDELAEEGGAE